MAKKLNKINSSYIDRYEVLSGLYKELEEYVGVSPSYIAQMRLNALAPSDIHSVKINEFLGVEPTDNWGVAELEDYIEGPRCIGDACDRMGTTKGISMSHIYLLKELKKG